MGPIEDQKRQVAQRTVVLLSAIDTGLASPEESAVKSSLLKGLDLVDETLADLRAPRLPVEA